MHVQLLCQQPRNISSKSFTNDYGKRGIKAQCYTTASGLPFSSKKNWSQSRAVKKVSSTCMQCTCEVLYNIHSSFPGISHHCQGGLYLAVQNHPENLRSSGAGSKIEYYMNNTMNKWPEMTMPDKMETNFERLLPLGLGRLTLGKCWRRLTWHFIQSTRLVW